jgi:2-oxoglutarate ferredoxin oxidoreductase subunit beta
VTVTSPFRSIDTPMDPVKLAVAFDASFVARGFAGNLKHLTEMVVAAIRHPGFSFVHVLSPCPTFRGMDEFKRIRDLIRVIAVPAAELGSRDAAFAREDGDPGVINLGILYKSPRPHYGEEAQRLRDISRASLDHEPTMQELLQEFMP